MGSSVLYESTDASAPILYDNMTTIINLLDKCLVQGYGSKSGLGWERAFANGGNTIVAYRNKGTGFYLVVYADANYASTGCTSKIESYEVMTAYNIGFLRNPEAEVNHYFCHANTRVGTRALKWKIIGDDKGFWIATEYSKTVGLWTVAYFGDYVPVHLSNKTNWINFTQLTLMEVGTNHLKCHNTTLNNEIRVSRDYLNNLPSQKVYFMSGCGVNTTNSNIQIGKSPLVSPINIYTVPLIATTVLYGWLPGLYEPICTTTTSSVTVYSANKSIINLQLNENTGRVGLLVGEGFRP